MQKKYIKVFWIFSIIIIPISIVLFFIPFQKALVFYVEDTDQVKAYLPIQAGDPFQIIFTHSIHLKDVVEKYRLTENGEIEQYEIVYEEYGIGMPSNAEEGENFVFENGKYHIKNMNKVFPSINIRNGRIVSEHRLVWGLNEEHIVNFNDYFTPGAWYTVKYDTLSLWNILKGVKIDDESTRSDSIIN